MGCNRLFQVLPALILMSLVTPAVAEDLKHQTKPNVVIFLADDQGWGDPSMPGGQALEFRRLMLRRVME